MPTYKNPNGYGSVVHLKGRRRNPFAVRKTTGYDDRGYPVYSIIGYYPTRKDAVYALAEFNHDPFDIDLAKITFSELYDRWSSSEFPKLSTSLASAHRSAYRHCSALYDLPYKTIRSFQMQSCIDNCGRGSSTQTFIRNLFVSLDRYAFEQDIIRKRYSSTLRVAPKETKKVRTLFSDSEVQTLWKHQGEPFVDETLFQLYTGFRLTEMLTTKCEDIDVVAGTICGGIKTDAGKNRIIPIHPTLRPVIERHLSSGYLFDHPRSATAKDPESALRSAYLSAWASALAGLGMTHTTHDCRHTFRSKLDSAGANKVCIDLLMGHKTGDIGERVYTHKTLQELSDAISLLNYGL